MGNSVALPSSEGIPSYVDLLEKDGRWQIIRVIRGGVTIGDLEAEIFDVLKRESPDAMILQVGIVECFPRPLRKRERAWLDNLRPLWIRDYLIGLIFHYRRRLIQLRPLIQRMPIAAFECSLTRVIGQCSMPVAILPMPPVASWLEQLAPGCNNQVARYNEVFRRMKRVYLDVFEGLKPDTLYIDRRSVHFHGEIHALIAQRLMRWLLKDEGQ